MRGDGDSGGAGLAVAETVLMVEIDVVVRMAIAQGTDRLSSYNPSTGEVIGSVPIFSAADVDAAVSRARVAAESWSQRSFAARAEELNAFRRAIAAAADDIATKTAVSDSSPDTVEGLRAWREKRRPLFNEHPSVGSWEEAQRMVAQSTQDDSDSEPT